MQHTVQVSQQTPNAHHITRRPILKNWKTEEWTETSTFCDSLPSQPIRGPGRSKCIMGGGRSLVAAQIHCQKRLPLLSSSLSSAAFLLPFCSRRRASFVAQGIHTTGHHYSLSDASLPSTHTPDTTTTRPPPHPHPSTITPCTDSYISYKRQRQRLQQSLFTVWNKDF